MPQGSIRPLAGSSPEGPTGDYDVTISEWGKPESEWLTGRVENFPRRRLTPWDLVVACLAACGLADRVTEALDTDQGR